MDTDGSFDLLVVGAGPGGYVAAIRAAQLGLNACVVEKGKLGGVCLNEGCIPSKALIHLAERFSARKSLAEMGLQVTETGFDYARVVSKARSIAEAVSRGVAYLLKKNGVTLVSGRATIVGPGRVALQNGTVLAGRSLVIATGSRPREIPHIPFDHEVVISSTDALFLQRLPPRLLVLGAGAIGCEFAHIMSSFGVQVTLVELLGQILPNEDPDTVSVLERSLRKRGVAVLTGTKAVSLQRTATGARVDLEGPGGPRQVEADQVLVVTGRMPNTEGIGLESLGLETQRGFIPVGDFGRTAAPGAFAIGDVTDTPMLAHVASKEGEIVAEHLAGRSPQPRVPTEHIPMAVYTEPQVASFGLSARSAEVRGIAFRKASFPFRGVGKAVAIEQSEGMVTVVFDPAGKTLLGAQIVGPEATELLHELLLAHTAGLPLKAVSEMIHAHPTLSESLMEAMRAAEGRAIHI